MAEEQPSAAPSSTLLNFASHSNAPPIPKHPGEITAEWLTEALRGQRASGLRVTSVEVDRRPARQGSTSEVARLHVKYANARRDLPATLIAKLPHRDQAIRASAADAGLYRTEHWFYSEVASRAGISVPHVYHSAIDRKTSDFVLLLEDLVGHGCEAPRIRTIGDIELALRAMASMHARCWDDPWLASLDEGDDRGRRREIHGAARDFTRVWREVSDDVGSMLPAEMRRACG
ncbi:MAG: hypothetical protein HY682_01465 [Chloroflexi bacterium]|nr:hypothetical protein [Chloroflexota bacterium]